MAYKKVFYVLLASITIGVPAISQPTRFWQINLGKDRRSALLHTIAERQASLQSDYVGPQKSLEKLVRIKGVFDAKDTGILEFALVPPIYPSQEDLVYAGTFYLKRTSSKAYATCFLYYFRKLRHKYGPADLLQNFDSDSVTVEALEKCMNDGKNLRFVWHDQKAGATKVILYKPEMPEKLILDYRITDILRITEYLRDTSDY